MKIQIVGSSYEMEDRSFASQRTINMYPIMAEVQGTKEVTALAPCPGLELFATAGGGPIRNSFTTADGRAFVVSGWELYEIETDGTATLQGTLLTGTGEVSIEQNPTQLMIVDGLYGYIFTLATDTFAQITDGDFPVPIYLGYQDGYFIVVKKDSQQFFISALNDGTSWDALDFTSVESNPDDLVACVSDNANLWLFGDQTTEVYQNTGSAAFPFERIPGAIMETGCAAPHTVRQMDNTIFWLGTDSQGQGIVWKAQGYDAVRVSTQAIEKIIEEATDFTDSYAWVYHQRGHVFYCLQIKDLETTLVYDAATQQWHERSWKDPATNTEQLHLGQSHFFFQRENMVGSRIDGKIYKMSLDYYDDAGDEMHRTRISPHYQEENRLITHSQLELDCAVGQGLTAGQGSDPKISLFVSDDGGHNYGNRLDRSLGKLGEYHTRVKWNKLGRSRDRVYKIVVTDPVFFQLNGAYLNGS